MGPTFSEEKEKWHVFLDSSSALSSDSSSMSSSPTSALSTGSASSSSSPLCEEELIAMKQRWDLLIRSFYDANTQTFNSSRIPDLFDMIKYDILHNNSFFSDLKTVYRIVKRLSDFVSPQEYGLLRSDKLRIGRSVSGPLLSKIFHDLQQAQQEPNVHSRVSLVRLPNFLSLFFPTHYLILFSFDFDLQYFTNETHLHSLRNLIVLANLPHSPLLAQALEAMELHYLSHIVFALFEDVTKLAIDPDRFFVSLHVSPGAARGPFTWTDEHHTLPVSRAVPVNGRIPFGVLHQLCTQLEQQLVHT